VLRALASLPDETARALASAVHAAIATPDLAALPALDRLAAGGGLLTSSSLFQ